MLFIFLQVNSFYGVTIAKSVSIPVELNDTESHLQAEIRHKFKYHLKCHVVLTVIFIHTDQGSAR